MIAGVLQRQWVCGRPEEWQRKPRWRKYPWFLTSIFCTQYPVTSLPFSGFASFWAVKDAVGKRASNQGTGSDNRRTTVPVKSSGNMQPMRPGRTLQLRLWEIKEFCRDRRVRNSRKLTELLYATSHGNDTKDSLEHHNTSTWNYTVLSLC